ncbi:MAG: RnfH family protein [Tatlockia sp.]|nr:RnfH family protein [Tatlockia sp.]
MVQVELIYIPDNQPLAHIYLSLSSGSTVADVLEVSGILEKYPEAKGYPVGIFSKPVTLDRIVKSGDRIEIYRPLKIDPKEKRRQRAKIKSL